LALDVARGLRRRSTIAAADGGWRSSFAARSPWRLPPLCQTDVLGVEIGGASRTSSPSRGDRRRAQARPRSAVAALTTRGFAELRRLGEALGARPDTLMGLSGLGRPDADGLDGAVAQFLYGIAVGEAATVRRRMRWSKG